MKKKILVIGCGGAGMFSSIVATQLKPGKFEATILSDEKDIYCRCTSPYILTKHATLKEAIQPNSMIGDYGVKLVPDPAVSVDFSRKEVIGKSGVNYGYDYLVIATGTSAFKPPIKGINGNKIHTVRTSEDIEDIAKHVKKSKKAVVIGGGIIGIEMAGALKERGMKVSIVEIQDKLLSGITDEEYSDKIKNLLESKKIDLLLNSTVNEIKTKRDKSKQVIISQCKKNLKLDADLIIVAAGVRPNTQFLEDSMLAMDKGYIIVNNKMKTNKSGVYACGDCSSSKSALVNEKWPSQLASVAIQQAKVVGYQMAGMPINYHGHTDAFAFKVLGKEFAQAGLDEEKARDKFKIVFTGRAETTDIYKDMKEHEPLQVKLIFAGLRGKLIGIQAYGKGVTGHVESGSLAMSLNAGIMKLLRYNYIAHPSLTPWPFMNPIIMAAEDAMGKVMARFKKKFGKCCTKK